MTRSLKDMQMRKVLDMSFGIHGALDPLAGPLGRSCDVVTLVRLSNVLAERLGHHERPSTAALSTGTHS